MDAGLILSLFTGEVKSGVITPLRVNFSSKSTTMPGDAVAAQDDDGVQLLCQGRVQLRRPVPTVQEVQGGHADWAGFWADMTLAVAAGAGFSLHLQSLQRRGSLHSKEPNNGQ